MKTLPYLLAATLLSAFISCQKEPESGYPDNISALLEQIADPPAKYRTAPLWDWNDKINREDIAFQLEQFKKGGLGGVFIHPRPGLVTEYLSDDWNELFAYTVKTGKELGMFVWIYDENSYPSGFAGGHVQDRFPESYNQGTGLGLKITKNLSDTVGLRMESILQKSPDSDYYVFYRTFAEKSWWYGGFPYVDLIYPGVTDTFIRTTMEGYEKYFGEEFGKTVPGIFTDEPNLPAAKGPGTLIRWTPDLFEQFSKRWGYKMEDNLISLVEEYGDWNKVRHNYHELMLELFLDRWAVPWNNYCEENNLTWTGHYWEHGWPYPGEGYDESAFYMYHQMPGIDMLGRVLCEDGMCQQFGNIRAVRELASAANQSGARRRFSETYGGAGWQVSFKDLKRLVDWECALGVNFVNQHLSYFSMQGVRKFDYPPTFSYQEPWWGDYSFLGDYTARISLALSAGEQINRILVIQPNTTAWMYHSDADRHDEIMELSKTFKLFLMELESSQLEYDLGSEQVIKRFGEMTDEGLRIGKRVYSKIILPPGMRNIDSSTRDKISQFIDYGNNLLVLTDSLNYINGSEYQGGSVFTANKDTDITEWFEQDDCVIKTTKGNPSLVFHQRRRMKNGELLFLINSDNSGASEVDLSWKGKYLAEVDLLTGEFLPIIYQKDNGQIHAKLTLPAVGSRLLISSQKELVKPEKNNSEEAGVKAVGEIKVQRLSDNILTIDYLDVETSDYSQKDVYFMDAMYKLFEWSGLPTGNPWQHKIQFGQTYLEMDKFDESTWHKIHYTFNIDENLTAEQMKSLRLVAERPDTWSVEINGHEVSPIPGEWWLDMNFPVYSIGGFVHPGNNTITLAASRMSVFSEIMPVYVLGDFSLRESAKGFIIQSPNAPDLGNWTNLGWQFYGGKVEYQQTFNVKLQPAENISYLFKAADWKGIIGEVFVNGESAGTLSWQPEIDITKYVRQGPNDVRFVITGFTLLNNRYSMI